MQKFNSSDIKSFEFTDLKGEHVIAHSKLEAFSFQTIEGQPFTSDHPSENTLREERSFEKKTEFKIDEKVREFRGLSRQEQNDLESRIQQEVQRRVEASYEKAYREGLEKGKEEGLVQAAKSLQDNVDVQVGNLSEMIERVKLQADNVLIENKKEVYDFIKRFTKWIIMKEIDEKVYLNNLLEKLILELNARKNLIIKVGQANFSQMPEVIQTIESKLGQLSNVRVEIVPEISYPGIILESESGLIDGSLEGVFSNIDKIFEQVLGNE